MSRTATLVDSEMATWAPDTRHYVTDDGQHFAITVHADLSQDTLDMISETLALSETPMILQQGDGMQTLDTMIVIQPTTVVPCDKRGQVIGQSVPEPLHTFEPGTSHEDALARIGYIVTEDNHTPKES